MMEEDRTADQATGRTEHDREESTIRSSRRRLLCGLAAGCSLLAGCSALTGNGDTATASPTPQSSTTTAGRTTEAETRTGTTTPTATPTPLPTELPTATEAATPVPTRTPAATATPAGTLSSTPARDVVSIASSDLTTYTNTRAGYSIKYPTGWRVLTSPVYVSIQPPSGRAHIDLYTYSDLPFSPSTLDAFAAYFLELFQGVFDELAVERRRTVTLPKGNRARVLYVLARSDDLPDIRLTWLFTIVNGTGYAVQVSLLDRAYTQTVERTIDTIIESFTVGTDSTNRPRTATEPASTETTGS